MTARDDFPYARYQGVTMDDHPIIPTDRLPSEPAMPPHRVRDHTCPDCRCSPGQV